MNGLYFGRNVDGGTFPADIWGDYMGRIKGSYCGDFAPPKEPFVGSPFYREVRQVRRRGPTTTSRRTTARRPRTSRRPTARPSEPGDDDAPDGGAPDEGFDPGAYEAPPQPEPDTVAPPPADGDGGATAPG